MVEFTDIVLALLQVLTLRDAGPRQLGSTSERDPGGKRLVWCTPVAYAAVSDCTLSSRAYSSPVYVDDHPKSARHRCPGLNLKTRLSGSGRT